MRAFALLLVLVSSLLAAEAPASPSVAEMLTEAERIREQDKTRSQQLLDAAKKTLTASPDPLLIARTHLLECNWADDPATAYRAFDLGLAQAKRAGNQQMEGRLAKCKARALWFEGKEADSEREFARAAVIARNAADPETESDAIASVGSLQYSRGAMADALGNLQRAYAMAERHGLTKQRLDTLSVIANVYADAKVAQYERAMEYYRQLLGEYEKLGRPADIADTLFNLGATYETLGNLREAAAHYRRALAVFQRIGNVADIAFTRRSLGSVLTKQGNPAQAIPLLDQATTYYARTAASESSTKQYATSPQRGSTSRARKTSASSKRTSKRLRSCMRSEVNGATHTRRPAVIRNSSSSSPSHGARRWPRASASSSTLQRKTARTVR